MGGAVPARAVTLLAEAEALAPPFLIYWSTSGLDEVTVEEAEEASLEVTVVAGKNAEKYTVLLRRDADAESVVRATSDVVRSVAPPAPTWLSLAKMARRALCLKLAFSASFIAEKA